MRKLKMPTIRFMRQVVSVIALGSFLLQGLPVFATGDVDLTSTQATMQAPVAGTIDVGGSAQTFAQGASVTTAEFVALTQVQSNGTQTLVVGASGAAAGGSFIVNQVGSNIGNLVVPQGVTAIHDFTSSSTLALSGNLTNAGNFYAVSNGPSSVAAAINATNIFNQPGALLTSVLPAGGLSGFSSAISNLSLNLTATNNIINSGTISSAASLSLVAGNSINNTLMMGQPVISAVNNLSMQASTIMNQGLISSQLGNLTALASTLHNEATMQALAGDLRISNLFGSNLNILNNGVMSANHNLIAEIVNANAVKPTLDIAGSGTWTGAHNQFSNPTGHLAIFAGDIKGPTSIDAGTLDMSVTAGTAGLNLDSVSVSGDPNLVYVGAGPFVSPAFNADGGFVNIDTSIDGVTGSITFTGAITTTPVAAGPGGAVTLLAGTTINTQDIDTTGNGGASGVISITAPGAITTGRLISPGQTATVTSTGGAINLNSAVPWNLGTTNITVSSPTGSTVQAAGSLTFGTGTISSPTAAPLSIASIGGTVDFTAPIAASSTPIISNGTLSITAGTVNMGAAGTLNLSSAGNLGTGYTTSTIISTTVAGGGIVFPGGGSALTINFGGSGGELIDQSAAPYANIGTTNLTIASGGDIHFQSNSFDNSGGGSMTLTVPSTAFFVQQFDILGLGTSRFSNVTSSGGPFGVVSGGIIRLSGTITNSTPSVVNGGGIGIISGAGCFNCPNTQTGIIVDPGAVITGINNVVVLMVLGTQTSPPANPAIPLINIGAGATVQSTGSFVGGVPNGGIVQISVNAFPPPPGLFATLNSNRPTLQVPSTGGGFIQYLPNPATYVSPGNSSSYGAGGVIGANGNGMVMIDNAGIPGLIAGSGSIFASGGLVYVGGASYAGEILINGSILGFLPFLATPPPIVPVPPVPIGGVAGAVPPFFLNLAGINNLNFGAFSNLGVDIVEKLPLEGQSSLFSGIFQNNDATRFRLTFSGQLVLFACQHFLLGSNKQNPKDESMVAAGAGTVISGQKMDESGTTKSIGLNRGKLLVMAGDKGLAVNTNQGTLDLGANSAAIVEQNERGQVIVSNLDGSALSLNIKQADGSIKKIGAEAGHQLVIGDSSDEVLIPTDVASTVEAAMTIKSPGRSQTIQRRAFSVKDMLEREKILLCVSGDSQDKLQRRMKDKLNAMKERALVPTPPGAQSSKPTVISDASGSMSSANQSIEDADGANYEPVAFTPNSAAPIAVTTLKTATALLKYTSATNVKVAPDGKVNLIEGELVILAVKPTTVQSGTRSITVKPGCMVRIDKDQQAFKVENLWELHTDSLRSDLGNKYVLTAAGSELVSTLQDDAYRVLHTDKIARRAVHQLELDAEHAVTLCDVSLDSLIRNSALLKAMIHSAQHEDQELVRKVIKMAAIINAVQADRGRYAQIGE